MTRHILLYGFLTLLFSACSKDFLDKGLLGEVEETNFMQNESDAILATNAAYNALRNWRYLGGFPVIDIMSDDVRKGSNPTDGIQVLTFDDFTFTADDASVTNWYTTLYLAIKRCNVVTERAPAIEMDATLKNRLIGEAKFLRAHAYFVLVRAYGGVPTVTTTTPERKLPRNTATEVYDLIESDLMDAINSLPERSEYAAADLGRATRGAAKALLAKAYLYQKDYVNAEKYALEVINSGQYSLDPNVANVFTAAGEHGPGSIFEISSTPFGFPEGGNQYGNTQGVRGTPNRGWGFGRPSYDLLKSFEPGDPRLDATVIYLNETLDGVTITGDGSTPDVTLDPATGDTLEIECYNQKVWMPGSGPLDSWGSNVRILRLADVILIAAEALNENNKGGEARTQLNKIRQRARGNNPNILPDVTETDKDLLRDLILAERRSEMAMELNRFFDLVRTGRAAQVLGPLGFIAGKHELLPIPQSEIDLSEGLLIQNPNW